MSASIIDMQEALAKLEAMSPPRNVLDAARKCMHNVAAGLRPPADLALYVIKWIGKYNSQDRYGK